MAKNQQRDKTEAVGMNVYHTDRYKNVYYDVLTKKAYVIFNSEVSKFNLYNTKVIAALLIGFACNYYLKMDAILSIIIGVAVYVICYIIFRLKMLPQLSEIEGFVKPEGTSYVDGIVERSGVVKISVMCLLLIVFITLTLINIKIQKFEGANLYLNYALALVGYILLVLNTMALIKKIRKK